MARNLGLTYEDRIISILEERGLLPFELKTNLQGNDAGFRHNGLDRYLELKNKTDTDFGQKGLKWNSQDGWEWKELDVITEMYSEIGILRQIGKQFRPNLYTVSKFDFTLQHRILDQRAFEKQIDLSGADYLHKFYARKNCFYIQVENKGFYYLERDIANLGVPRFDPTLRLRLRAKVRNSFPAYNYGFFATLKVNKRSIRKSDFDIEEKMGRRFPPFTDNDFTAL
jgi:hypothetical protein